MLHPTHEQNPHLPAEFGKPGSILSNRPELEPENYTGDRNKGGVPVYRLWVKFRGGEGKKVERICYFGEYEVKKEGPLSGTEFQALDRNVRMIPYADLSYIHVHDDDDARFARHGPVFCTAPSHTATPRWSRG